MSTTWAIASHMIAEGIRMKIALVFLVLIALIVLGLPLSISGDSSLSDAVQSFMSFGLNATGVLLGILTVFLSRSLADELVHRQILLVMTKPVPRWKYVVGKWLGITILNAVFLLGAGVTIYGMVHYIRATHASRNPDRSALDREFEAAELANEVLVARHASKTKLPDFEQPARAEFERNIEDGRYDNILSFNPDKLKADIALKHEMRWRVLGPGETRLFEFENVLCDRSEDKVVQIRYKTNVTSYANDEIFRAVWQAGDPNKGTPVYQSPVRQQIGRFHTVTFPANVVASDGTLTAYFRNENPFPNEEPTRSIIEFRRSDEVTVLFTVGSFEWNLVRLMTLMMCKLVFLAAVAILMVTVFSYPVACLCSFCVYVLAGTRSFILQAVDFASDDYSGMFTSFKEFGLHIVNYAYDLIHWVVPDFARFNAVEDFVGGYNVSLTWVLNGILWLVMVKTVLVLGLAILLFHRREVAEVSF